MRHKNTNRPQHPPKPMKGRSVEVKDEFDLNKAMRKLKKKVEESKVLEEVRKRQHYEKPSAQRKRAAASAKARYRKELEKQVTTQKKY